MRYRRCAALVALIWSLPLVSAFGWSGDEHIKIGMESYYRACTRLLVEQQNTLTGPAVDRLQVACTLLAAHSPYHRTNVFAYESLAGEWSALAADHTRTPEQLTSVRLGDEVVNYLSMTRIVTTNYRHFHPASTTSWRADHLKSLEAATAASKATGIHMVEQFESALAIQAFAQHYLQDSFAAGHMGFNRIASSNAAALTYHNQMSKVGRCIASELSDVWYTFGDDHLYQSSDGAEHVMAAAASSFHDFLFAFVTGDINTLGWQDVWSQLPAYFNETATTPEQCQPGGAWQPLRSVSKPANAASTFEVATVTDAAIYRPAARGLLFGSSYELAPIQVGYRVIQSRVFGGMGLTTRELGNTALLLDLGFLWHVGTSTAGTVTHEVGYGEYMYFEIKHGSWRGISFRAFYAANFEAGRVYLRFQTGAAYSYGRWAPHVSTGIGWVRMAGR